MCLKKWCMIGEEYIYSKFVDKRKNSTDKWNIAEIQEKTMNKVNNIRVDANGIYVRCDGEGVEPSNTLLAKE